MVQRILFVLLFVLVVLSGCKKEIIEPEPAQAPNQLPQVTSDFLFDNTMVTKSLDELAKIVAFSLEDKEFRRFVKNEAMKQVDGDFDVIYELTKNNAVKGKISLKDFLSQKAAILTGKKIDIDKLIEKIPAFQISVPVNCEKWDEENYTPLVTYVPESFDERTFTFVKAYDSKGNVYTLPLDKEPDVPVVVLGSCERLDYLNRKNRIPPGGGGGTGGGNGNNIHYEYLHQLQITNLWRIETWIQGKPELRYVVIAEKMQNTIVVDNTIDKNKLPGRKELQKKLNIIDYPLFHWYSNLGSFYVIGWTELDGGDKVWTIPIDADIPLDHGTLHIHAVFNIYNKDDYIGRQVIFISNPVSTIYELTYKATNTKFRWTRKQAL